MTKEKVLVVGLGEVGRPMLELLKESGQFTVYGLDIDDAKMRALGQQSPPPSKVDVMHFCLPCFDQDRFVSTVVGYIQRFEPRLVIINSTVPPGTTTRVYKECKSCLVAHSPIRGVHKSPEHMKWEIKRWTKYVGGADPKASDLASKHLEKVGLKTRVLKSCLETELAKLFETTYRAWMIACFQEMHRISRHFNADFSNVVDFIEDTHNLRLDRPIMYPGTIGGHCLIPNVKLLLESYDSEFLRLILDSNEKRGNEIKDSDVQIEIEKVRRRSEALQERLMKKHT